MERVGVIVVRRPYITALTGLSVPERNKKKGGEKGNYTLETKK